MLQRAGERERTGHFEEAQERRVTYGRYLRKKVKEALSSSATQERIQRGVDAALSAEIERIVAEKVKRQIEEVRDAQPVLGPPAGKILKAVAEATEFTVADLLGRRRYPSVSRARQLGYHLFRSLRPDLSFPAIGRVFVRHHTSIMSGCEVFAEHQDQEPIKSWLMHPTIRALK